MIIVFVFLWEHSRNSISIQTMKLKPSKLEHQTQRTQFQLEFLLLKTSGTKGKVELKWSTPFSVFLSSLDVFQHLTFNRISRHQPVSTVPRSAKWHTTPVLGPSILRVSLLPSSSVLSVRNSNSVAIWNVSHSKTWNKPPWSIASKHLSKTRDKCFISFLVLSGFIGSRH